MIEKNNCQPVKAIEDMGCAKSINQNKIIKAIPLFKPQQKDNIFSYYQKLANALKIK